VISYAHAPAYCLTFISFAPFIWATEKFQKKLIFTSCSVLIDFCHYLCLPLDLFLFEFFWSQNFWGSCYSSLCFNACYTWVETEPKSRFTIVLTLMLLIRIVWSFVWRKFSSVGKGEWWHEMKYGQKLKLGDAHDDMRWSMDKSSSLGMPMLPQEVSKKYKRQSLGMPRGTSSSSTKIMSSFKTLYFYWFIYYASFLEPLYFCF
jgi:hypothetical protein